MRRNFDSKNIFCFALQLFAQQVLWIFSYMYFNIQQLSIRAKSTKDNPRTLPISAYGHQTLTANPSSCVSKISPSNIFSQETSSSESEDNGIFQWIETALRILTLVSLCFLVKGSTHLVSHDRRASEMFLLELWEQDCRPHNQVIQQKIVSTHRILRAVCCFTMSSLVWSSWIRLFVNWILTSPSVILKLPFS